MVLLRICDFIQNGNHLRGWIRLFGKIKKLMLDLKDEYSEISRKKKDKQQELVRSFLRFY